MHNTPTCLLLQSLSFPFAVPKWLVNSNEADNEPCKMTASRSLEFPSRAAALQDKISFHLTKKFVFKYVSLRCLGNPVDYMTDCFNFWILTQEAPQERAAPFLVVKEKRQHWTANVLTTQDWGGSLSHLLYWASKCFSIISCTFSFSTEWIERHHLL